jgi:hypothetical protein
MPLATRMNRGDEMTTLLTMPQTIDTPLMKVARDHKTESPDDLRAIVGERGLIELALQSVSHFGSALPMWHKTTEPELSSRMLLALLTYCYAAGLYASADIHWACRRDSGARYLCANTWPDELSLRRFRRKWRPLIQSCLAWVCAMAEATQDTGLGECKQPLVGPLDQHTQLAGQRIESAILLDLAACD